MPIECKLVERTSKNGVKYVCLEIYLTKTYKKMVFLTPSEKELIVLTNQK